MVFYSSGGKLKPKLQNVDDLGVSENSGYLILGSLSYKDPTIIGHYIRVPSFRKLPFRGFRDLGAGLTVTVWGFGQLWVPQVICGDQ